MSTRMFDIENTVTDRAWSLGALEANFYLVQAPDGSLIVEFKDIANRGRSIEIVNNSCECLIQAKLETIQISRRDKSRFGAKLAELAARKAVVGAMPRDIKFGPMKFSAPSNFKQPIYFGEKRRITVVVLPGSPLPAKIFMDNKDSEDSVINPGGTSWSKSAKKVRIEALGVGSTVGEFFVE